MFDPYRMVLINAIILLTLVVGIFIYKFVYPKKKLNPLILVIIFALLPLVSLLRAGSYESGDFSYNIYNSILYYSSLLEGNIPPAWADISNATYGYPLFIFIYPLPYIIISIFHFVGFSFVASLKLFIATSFICSGIGMFLFTKAAVGKKSAFIAALFYLYAPYHLIDMHYRVSTGEIASFAILPFVFYFAYKTLCALRLRWILCLTLSLSLLILSNQAIAIFAYGLVLLYSLLVIYCKRGRIIEFFPVLFSIVYSLLISAFYWLPVMLESKFTHQAEFVQQIGYVPIEQLFFSTWRYGLLFQGPHGELSFLIGYVQIIVVLVSIYYLYKRKFARIDKLLILFFLIGLFSFCYLMTSGSHFVWDNVKILRNFQFTFRLLLLVAFCVSIIAGILAKKINNLFIFILCAVLILQSILNWGNRRTIPEFNDKVLASQIALNTATIAGFHPAVPKWVDINHPWFTKIPARHIEIVRGNAQISELKRTSTEHTYILSVKSPTLIKENTAYFPGWSVRLNNRLIPINYQDKRFPGVITFKLDKGTFLAEVRFDDTPLRRRSKIVSILSLILLCIIYFSRRKLSFLPKF